MKPGFVQILGIHLALLLLIGLLGRFSAHGDNSSFFGYMVLATLVLAPVDLITGIVLLLIRKKEAGKNFLLCSGIMLLVGGSACMGAFAVG